MNSKASQFISRYSNIEAILGANKLAGGTRHFGYYPSRRADIPESEAVKNMESLAAEVLGIKGGHSVLDAGCGQGDMACRIASNTNAYVTGITIVPKEKKAAEKKAASLKIENLTRFVLEDFTHTSFDDNDFDRIYMMESIDHAYMLYQTIYEMYRVLRADGKIAIFYYSTAPPEQISSTLNPAEAARFNKSITNAVKFSSLFSLPDLKHGELPKIMCEIGFYNVNERILDDYVRPSFKRVYKIANAIYPMIALMGLQTKFRHTTVVAELIGWALNHPDLIHYNLLTAEKPEQPQTTCL